MSPKARRRRVTAQVLRRDGFPTGRPQSSFPSLGRFWRRLLLLSFGVAGLACAASPALEDAKDEALSGWSRTRPSINLTHVFEGEINRRGRPVGFHSRPGGRDPSDARLVRIESRPNRWGVYRAQVEIRREDEVWLSKRSTIFPDRWRQQEVINAILHAYRKGGKVDRRSGARFRGPSGHGFTIEGYLLRDGRINTAYPIYQRDRR